MTSVLAPTSPRTVNARNPGGSVSRDDLVKKVMADGMRKRDAERAVDFYLQGLLTYADPTGNTAVNNVLHEGTVKRR